MKRGAVAFATGFVFAAGLCLAGMTRPARVLAFLDVFGRWDPSLALVMAGAIAVAAIAFRVAARRASPMLGGDFLLPQANAPIDPAVLGGAALFGLGWGLSGLCPGPAIVALASGQTGAFVFVGAMFVGTVLQGWSRSRNHDDTVACRVRAKLAADRRRSGT